MQTLSQRAQLSLPRLGIKDSGNFRMQDLSVDQTTRHPISRSQPISCLCDTQPLSNVVSPLSQRGKDTRGKKKISKMDVLFLLETSNDIAPACPGLRSHGHRDQRWRVPHTARHTPPCVPRPPSGSRERASPLLRFLVSALLPIRV